jgi:hypothetical protein
MSCQKNHSCACPKIKRIEQCRHAGISVDDALKNWFCDPLQEKSCKQFEAAPPRMTSEEFVIEQDKILKEIPEEFKSALSYMAYERGHSAGHEEVMGILKELVNDLKQPIADFQKRISMEIHNAMIEK